MFLRRRALDPRAFYARVLNVLIGAVKLIAAVDISARDNGCVDRSHDSSAIIGNTVASRAVVHRAEGQTQRCGLKYRVRALSVPACASNGKLASSRDAAITTLALTNLNRTFTFIIDS